MSTDNQVKKYRLLKDLPDSNVGDEYIWNNSMEAYYKNGNVQDSYWKGYAIENNPEWFEEVIEQPKQERIEVELTRGFNTETPYQWISHFYCTKKLSDKDLPKISQAIESVLNKDTVVEDSSGLKTGIMSQMDMYNMGYKDGVKYAQFTKPEQPTNDNAFVWDESLVGGLTEWASSNDWTYLPSKNKWFNEEDEINITPITTEQLINKFKQSKQSAPEPSALPTKEWEIESFVSYNPDYVFNRGNDGYFRCKHYKHIDDKWDEPTLLYHETKQYKIHSVRRLSDNVVFSVGDIIEGSQLDNHNIVSHSPTKITAIRIINETIGLAYGNGGEIIIRYAKKLPPETPPIVKDRVQTSIELMKHYCKSIQFIFDNAGDKNPFIVLEEIRCAERNYEIAKQKLSQ